MSADVEGWVDFASFGFFEVDDTGVDAALGGIVSFAEPSRSGVLFFFLAIVQMQFQIEIDALQII